MEEDWIQAKKNLPLISHSQSYFQAKYEPTPPFLTKKKNFSTMADDDEDIAALVIDNGSGMCKG